MAYKSKSLIDKICKDANVSLLATGDGTMAYMSQEHKAQLQPAVKEILKKYGLKGRLGVDHYSTLVLNVTEGNIDFIQNYNETCGESIQWAASRCIAKDHIDVNVYWFRDHFTGKALEFLTEVYAAMMVGNWDNSQPEYDHFDKGWYVSIRLGQWNKPYNFVG